MAKFSKPLQYITSAAISGIIGNEASKVAKEAFKLLFIKISQLPDMLPGAMEKSRVKRERIEPNFNVSSVNSQKELERAIEERKLINNEHLH